MSGTEKYSGLSQEQVAASRKLHGRNELASAQKPSFLKTALKEFSEPAFLLLIGAACIYFALGQPRDGCIMIFFVAASGAVNLYQEWRTDKTLDALKDLSSPKVTVIREGQEQEIASEELVPGDVMLLAEGQRIPADARLLFCDGLGVGPQPVEPVQKRIRLRRHQPVPFVRLGRLIVVLAAHDDSPVLRRAGVAVIFRGFPYQRAVAPHCACGLRGRCDGPA